MGYYLVAAYGLSPSTAEAITSMIVILPIFTAVIAGRHYDRTARPKLMIVASLVVSSGALLVGAFPSPLAALACSVAGGVAAGFGYTTAFAGAKDLNPGNLKLIEVDWIIRGIARIEFQHGAFRLPRVITNLRDPNHRRTSPLETK